MCVRAHTLATTIYKKNYIRALLSLFSSEIEKKKENIVIIILLIIYTFMKKIEENN